MKESRKHSRSAMAGAILRSRVALPVTIFVVANFGGNGIHARRGGMLRSEKHRMRDLAAENGGVAPPWEPAPNTLFGMYNMYIAPLLWTTSTAAVEKDGPTTGAVEGKNVGDGDETASAPLSFIEMKGTENEKTPASGAAHTQEVLKSTEHKGSGSPSFLETEMTTTSESASTAEPQAELDSDTVQQMMKKSLDQLSKGGRKVEPKPTDEDGGVKKPEELVSLSTVANSANSQTSNGGEVDATKAAQMERTWKSESQGEEGEKGPREAGQTTGKVALKEEGSSLSPAASKVKPQMVVIDENDLAAVTTAAKPDLVTSVAGAAAKNVATQKVAKFTSAADSAKQRDSTKIATEPEKTTAATMTTHWVSSTPTTTPSNYDLVFLPAQLPAAVAKKQAEEGSAGGQGAGGAVAFVDLMEHKTFVDLTGSFTAGNVEAAARSFPPSASSCEEHVDDEEQLHEQRCFTPPQNSYAASRSSGEEDGTSSNESSSASTTTGFVQLIDADTNSSCASSERSVTSESVRDLESPFAQSSSSGGGSSSSSSSSDGRAKSSRSKCAATLPCLPQDRGALAENSTTSTQVDTKIHRASRSSKTKKRSGRKSKSQSGAASVAVASKLDNFGASKTHDEDRPAVNAMEVPGNATVSSVDVVATASTTEDLKARPFSAATNGSSSSGTNKMVRRRSTNTSEDSSGTGYSAASSRPSVGQSSDGHAATSSSTGSSARVVERSSSNRNSRESTSNINEDQHQIDTLLEEEGAGTTDGQRASGAEPSRQKIFITRTGKMLRRNPSRTPRYAEDQVLSGGGVELDFHFSTHSQPRSSADVDIHDADKEEKAGRLRSWI
ncbi:unnamed protein product [Amoebophrya sp. A120]|nr:unnamed protein product [Amoebophrya sp. A120]|eukprot:GSA120T00016885001.1